MVQRSGGHVGFRASWYGGDRTSAFRSDLNVCCWRLADRTGLSAPVPLTLPLRFECVQPLNDMRRQAEACRCRKRAFMVVIEIRDGDSALPHLVD